MSDLLQVTDLRTDIRQRKSTVHAVGGVSFSIGAGEMLGLVGESGSGKSMTGMSLVRLLPPGGHIVGGEILLNGEDLTKLSDDRLRRYRGNDVSVIFQDPMTSLDPTMTVGRQIAEPVRLHRGATKKQAMDRAAEVLDLDE